MLCAPAKATDKTSFSRYNPAVIRSRERHWTPACRAADQLIQAEFDCLKVLAERRPVEPLSPRETLILGMRQRGWSVKEIAGKCGISENTVKFHLKEVNLKLNTHSAREAILKLSQVKPAA